jgi:tetratricopeptide (TPR) repeat protein
MQVLTDHAARLRTRDVELMAPRDLVRRRVLDLTDEQEHCFAVELFRRWVRQHKPLQAVKDELDRVDPLADELFGIGQEFFRRNQSKTAVRYFRDALAANPHHFHARLCLGETLLQLKQPGKAVAELERTYEQDREETRVLLTRALVAQARVREKAGDENGALAVCKRAFQISPNDRAAQKIQNTILMRRLEVKAQNHEQAERWVEATTIYEQR